MATSGLVICILDVSVLNSLYTSVYDVSKSIGRLSPKTNPVRALNLSLNLSLSLYTSVYDVSESSGPLRVARGLTGRRHRRDLRFSSLEV